MILGEWIGDSVLSEHGQWVKPFAEPIVFIVLLVCTGYEYQTIFSLGRPVCLMRVGGFWGGEPVLANTVRDTHYGINDCSIWRF